MFNIAEEFPPVRIGHVLKLAGIAAIIVLIGIAIYVYFGRIPPSAEGEMLDFAPYQAQVKADAPISVTLSQAKQPLLVLTRVKIRNVGKKPLSVFELAAILTIGDAEYRSLNVSDADFERVFQFFPNLTRQEPVPEHTVIQPGQTVQGLLIFNYPMTMDQWNKRNSFRVTVSFDNEPDLVLRDAVPSTASVNE